MKKMIWLLLILGIITIGIYSYQKHYTNKPRNPEIQIDKVGTNLNPEKNRYIDNNPIKIGLYKYYNRYKDRELITEYRENWNYHKDISSFEVFYTIEEKINGNYFQDTFKQYLENYENIQNYKIGYKISFNTNDNEINKIILSPKDTEEFFDYLEIYLYDDFHRQKGIWYNHTTEEEMNEETLLTSIKLTAGKNINEIISDIKVEAFTYDYDDFDNAGNYRGISKYSIIVKRK